MNVRSAVPAIALGLALISGACSPGAGSASGSGGNSTSGGGVGSGGSSSGSGGSSNTGGSSGTCSNVTACGGSLVGTWTVASSCLSVSGQVDLTLVGAGCPSAPVTGSLQVTGTWTANADGTYMDDTTTTGQEQLTLA